jgi:hypothetical protein
MLSRFKESLLATWKLLLSLRKRNWKLRDYPVLVRRQNITLDPEQTSPRCKPCGYVAYVVNWHLVGGGDTRQEAMQELAANFERAAADRSREGTQLPRPGTKVPIQFAPQDRVNAHGALVDDFVHRVLGFDGAWISDESSLWDFHCNESNESLQAKIREVYGMDVSDIESGNLVQILDRIATGHPAGGRRSKPQ